MDLILLVGTRLGDVNDANHGGDAQENFDGAKDGGVDFQFYADPVSKIEKWRIFQEVSFLRREI